MKHTIFQKSRFLIVDDELANIEVLRRMLKQWGATNICSTSNPHEALNLFDTFKPDVVLLDLRMPELDGFEVMGQIKPRISHDDFLPFLILTADSSERTKRRALLRGATDFLTKPFDSIELCLRLNSLLDRRLLHQRLQVRIHTLDLEVQERTRQLEQAETDTIECWAMAAEYRDDETGHHAQRVGQMAAKLAQALGLQDQHTNHIRRAAPLHDVGKIGIPDYLLLKPEKLTPAEFAVIKTHTTIGAAILARHNTPLLQQASVIALTHHERWDGGGYPQGLRGEDIPLCGRIVAVADVFDALIHERPYKKAWPLDQTIEEIQRQSGSQFDPQVVTAFMKVMRGNDQLLQSYPETQFSFPKGATWVRFGANHQRSAIEA